MINKRKILVLVVIAVLVFSSAAFLSCKQTSTQETVTTEVTATETTTVATAAETTPSKDIVISYITKSATHPWFVMEIDALQKKFDDLGVTLKVIDANGDNEAFIQGVEASIAEEVSGMLLVPTDQSLGPAIVEKAAEANIPIATIDDSLPDKDGNFIPHFGVETKAMGTVGGHGLAQLARERGFFEEGNIVKVMLLDMTMLSVVHERILGYKEALMQDVPELKEEDYIAQDTDDAMMEAALPVVSGILNANPEVTHWIVAAVADDQTIGALTIFEENGFPLENVLACANGGFKIFLEEMEKGNNSLSTVKLDSVLEAETAAEQMYKHITEGSPLIGALVQPVGFVHLGNYKDFDWSSAF